MDYNNKRSKDLSTLRDIQIAKLAFIGASIATLGDGIGAVAAALALEALENPIDDERSSNQAPQMKQIETTQHQLDYFINELIQIRESINRVI
ncbi:translation initiation factor 2 [Paenibacillus sp. NEAU-GSW1]|uniref:translation initiation factor 2 n=1 Tax=Paenibacillus sp. NEAU-GSW1 TaxID=2682486 RepID=UPI0012E17ECA|nr:translation initiation factor 2 [Paenibacillus sp. NEAU-GSW1]MUT67092.1 translation initiation factor 2 [Paenibacillus sp. NEAU-GSW1]